MEYLILVAAIFVLGFLVEISRKVDLLRKEVVVELDITNLYLAGMARHLDPKAEKLFSRDRGVLRRIMKAIQEQPEEDKSKSHDRERKPPS